MSVNREKSPYIIRMHAATTGEGRVNQHAQILPFPSPRKDAAASQPAGNGATALATDSAPRRDAFDIFMRVLYVVSFAVYLFFLLDGLSFYQTDFSLRPRHEAYRELRPAGFRGHGFGIIGSTMMILMLLYSVRKRTRLLGRIGSLKRWLAVHIYFGIMGPLFVILHTTFKLNGLVAVSFWSMIAVASSGIFGRYLYLQIPRNRFGEELGMKEIEEQNTTLLADIQSELGLDDRQMETFMRLSEPSIDLKRGLLVQFLAMIVYDLTRPLRRFRLRRRYANELNLSGPLLEQAINLAYRRRRLQRRIVLLNQVQQLFHYWHVFHKPFAILMYLIMVVHVGVAVWLGYTWIF